MKNQKVILTIEDEYIIALSIKMKLESSGYNVIHASTPAAALECIQDTEIDLIVSDINLGKNEIDGVELVKKILAVLEVPVIFFSSQCKVDLVGRLDSVKFHEYIEKCKGVEVLMRSVFGVFKI